MSLQGITDHVQILKLIHYQVTQKPPNKAHDISIACLIPGTLFSVIYGVFGHFSGFNRLWKNKGVCRSDLIRIYREHGNGMKHCKENKWLSDPVFISHQGDTCLPPYRGDCPAVFSTGTASHGALCVIPMPQVKKVQRRAWNLVKGLEGKSYGDCGLV